MSKCKEVKGVPLGAIRLQRGEHASFVFGDNGQHICTIKMEDDGTPSVECDSTWYVHRIMDLSGGDD